MCEFDICVQRYSCLLRYADDTNICGIIDGISGIIYNDHVAFNLCIQWNLFDY